MVISYVQMNETSASTMHQYIFHKINFSPNERKGLKRNANPPSGDGYASHFISQRMSSSLKTFFVKYTIIERYLLPLVAPLLLAGALLLCGATERVFAGLVLLLGFTCGRYICVSVKVRAAGVVVAGLLVSLAWLLFVRGLVLSGVSTVLAGGFVFTVPLEVAGGLVDVLGILLLILDGLLLAGAVILLLFELGTLLVSVVLRCEAAAFGSRAFTTREGWNVLPVAFSTSLTCGPIVYLLLPPLTVP